MKMPGTWLPTPGYGIEERSCFQVLSWEAELTPFGSPRGILDHAVSLTAFISDP